MFGSADGVGRGEGLQVRARIAAEMKRPWPDIAAAFYSDVIDFQPLKAFHGYADPEALLSRYNVAQLQACLYRAQSVLVGASADFKTILRYVKLSRLLHEIRRPDESHYRIELTGPATLLHQTRSYGVNFARFVGALLACRGWEMSAQILTPWKTSARLCVSDRDGYHTHLPPPEEFDSSIEQQFASAFGPQREGWTLIREGAILHEGQATFVPDFVLRHENSREVLLEIVGFWTPEYLERKRQTLRRFRRLRILLVVAERHLRSDLPAPGVLTYKKRIDPEVVVHALADYG